ncbi:MAG: GNAT family N-acetyltransferase [Crocinitomicaceae bacterium]|nr:GNAT family N-acetyltransferase [Flavobacteriales bacterium]NQZ38059.1 GNAT family N-acetyltransferase [Crocinitomicaceae bacterium]
MNNSTSITTLKEADFQDLLIIADNRFGSGYLTMGELQSYVANKTKIGFVAKTNQIISGFSLVQICDLNEIMSLVLCEHEWFKEQFADKYPIGVIKTISVSEEFKNCGIGTALTEKSIKALEKASGALMSICWEHEKGTPFAKILEKFGMTLSRRISDYWKEDSLKKKYQCKYCGSPPCRCSVLVYQ